MSEKTLWSYLANGMKRRWHATRHEDLATAGIPDVSYGIHGINGWIELKASYGWPKYPKTRVYVGLSREQQTWIALRGAAGDNVWILFRVKHDYLLFNWKMAPALGQMTKTEMFQAARRAWRNSIDFDELEGLLSQR